MAIFLLLVGFYQYKNAVYEIILPITEANVENNSGVQFLVKLKYPQKVLYQRKIHLQFELSKINSSTTDKLTENSNINSSLANFQYSINFQSRLELPGIHIDPSGMLEKKFVENMPLNFDWDLLPINRGTYQGTLWLYANLIPENPLDKLIKETLLAKPIQIEVVTIFGLSSFSLKILGVVSLLFSLIFKNKTTLIKE